MNLLVSAGGISEALKDIIMVRAGKASRSLNGFQKGIQSCGTAWLWGMYREAACSCGH